MDMPNNGPNINLSQCDSKKLESLRYSSTVGIIHDNTKVTNRNTAIAGEITKSSPPE